MFRSPLLPRSSQKYYVPECVFVAVFTQQAKQMCPSILSRVACPALQYFPTLSHEWEDFREQVTVHKMCFFILMYNTSMVSFDGGGSADKVDDVTA